MRVLIGVVHIADLQRVVKFYFAKGTISVCKGLAFRTVSIAFAL